MKKQTFVGLVIMVILSIAFSVYCAEAKIKNIRFWSDQSEPWQQEVIRGMIGEFESAHPDVKVEVEYISWKDREAKFTAALMGGTEPEVALLASQYQINLSAQGKLANLDDVIGELGGPDAFWGASLSLASYEGHYYNLPYTTLPVVLWYRKDLFEENGLKPPVTWDDLYNSAKVLNEKGSGKYFGLGIPYGRNEWLDETFRVIALWPTGGKVFDNEGNVVFNSPETLRALNFYKSLHPFTPTGSETWSYTETMKSFVTGTCAMSLYYGRTLKNLEQYNPEILPKTGAILPPKDKYHRTLNIPQGIGVFKDSRYPEAGKEFVKFFLSSDYYVKFLWATPGHNLPTIRAKADQWRQNELLQKYPDIVDTLFKACDPEVGFVPEKEPGIQVPGAFWQAVRGAFVIPDAVQKVVLKREDPKKVLEWAEKEMKRIVAEFRM